MGEAETREATRGTRVAGSIGPGRQREAGKREATRRQREKGKKEAMRGRREKGKREAARDSTITE